MTNLYEQQPCERFAPLISALLDGELTEETSVSLNEHLSECETCRQRARSFREIDNLIFQFSDSQFVSYPLEQEPSLEPVVQTVPRTATMLPEDRLIPSRHPFPDTKSLKKKGAGWTRWIPLAVAATILIGLMVTTFPSQRSTVTAEQIAKPLAELEFIEAEYQDSLQRMLQMLKLDLRALKVEMLQLGESPDDAQINRKDQLQNRLEQLIQQVETLETKTDPDF